MNIFIIQGGLVISTMLCLTLCLVEGCQFFFRKDLNLEIINYHHTANGRLLLLNVKYNEKCFTLVKVSNFEKERVYFFKRLESWIDKYTLNHDVLIVC